ncbi:alpha/beta fold hydrolase [Kibdelosporangium philippinense]|uniref:Alpha/beta fold hydrolase n=1 Tax=Kibdelosporangium philippinense TaxID=211113 RepID=A0ABS8ZMY1_9PSEU|nr:alpha/beta fold hydrolase [Kibdelosporangium philippinense]MCE7008919.1 alpha/beta fold hydrolase [Kibdelosporangium philippinense]
MRDLLLLHGAGGTPAQFERFIAEMPDFHCVAPDLNGLTTWEAMLDHLEGLKLDNPAVVGSSLGGALAIYWAKRHPECPGVVNLDGHGHPSTYPGLTDAEVGSWKAKLKELFDEMAKQLPPEHVALRSLVDNSSVRELYDGLTAPAIAVVAMELMPAQEPFAEFFTAARKGVLADLAGRRVIELPGDHGLLGTHSSEIANLVRRFLLEG